MQRKNIQNIVLGISFLIMSTITVNAETKRSDNIITGVTNARIAANGIIGGEPTEIWILFNAKNSPQVAWDSDPSYFGHQIPAGGKMTVKLGGSFVPNPAYTQGPLLSLFHLALLPGYGHQHNPIVPAAGGVESIRGNWELQDFDHGNMSFSIVPLGGVGFNGLEGNRAKKLGVKHLHLRPDPRGGGNISKTPFLNGPAGSIGTVTVQILDSEGVVVEEGFGSVTFRKSIGRIAVINNIGVVRESIFDLNVFNDVLESVNWQHVPPNSELILTEAIDQGLPFFANGYYAPRFQLIEAFEQQTDSFFPFNLIPDVTYIVNSSIPSQASIVQNGDVIGSIVMKGPSVNSTGMILPAVGVTSSHPLSRLIVPCKVGTEAGVYSMEVTLIGGDTETLHIVVD